MKILKTQLSLSSNETESIKAQLLTLGPLEQSVFLDIETTGFNRTYDSVYLIGYLYYENQSFYIEQHLASSLQDEPVLLTSYTERMQDFSLCITYNGDMFDLAFLESRMKTLHIPCDFLSFRSLDLLKQYRPYAKFFGWDNCKLKTVEQFLGTRRDDAFDGGQLIDVYYEYIRRDDPALERVLLLHNFEDVQNLARLLRIRDFLSILTDSAVLTVGLRDSLISEEGEWRSLEIHLDRQIPFSHETWMPLQKKSPLEGLFSFEAGSSICYVTLPVTAETLRYYLPNPKDYYYLPEQDTILHKSLAADTPPRFRRAATTANCCIRRQGLFLFGGPPLADVSAHPLHGFRRGPKDSTVYYELDELTHWFSQQISPMLTAYIRGLWKLSIASSRSGVPSTDAPR